MRGGLKYWIVAEAMEYAEESSLSGCEALLNHTLGLIRGDNGDVEFLDGVLESLGDLSSVLILLLLGGVRSSVEQ